MRDTATMEIPDDGLAAAPPRLFAPSAAAADVLVAQLLGRNDVLDAVARLMRDLLGLRTLIVAQPHPQTGQLVIVAAVFGGVGSPRPSAAAAASLAEACWPLARATRRAVVVEDAEHDPRLGALAARRELGIHGYVAVPVVAPDGSCWGVACGIDRQPCPRSTSEADLVQVLARVVAVQSERERVAHARGAELVATTAQHELNNALAKVGLRAQLLGSDPDLPAGPRTSVDALQKSLEQATAALRRFRRRIQRGRG